MNPTSTTTLERDYDVTISTSYSPWFQYNAPIWMISIANWLQVGANRLVLNGYNDFQIMYVNRYITPKYFQGKF